MQRANLHTYRDFLKKSYQRGESSMRNSQLYSRYVMVVYSRISVDMSHYYAAQLFKM